MKMRIIVTPNTNWKSCYWHTEIDFGVHMIYTCFNVSFHLKATLMALIANQYLHTVTLRLFVIKINDVHSVCLTLKIQNWCWYIMRVMDPSIVIISNDCKWKKIINNIEASLKYTSVTHVTYFYLLLKATTYPSEVTNVALAWKIFTVVQPLIRPLLWMTTDEMFTKIKR